MRRKTRKTRRGRKKSRRGRKKRRRGRKRRRTRRRRRRKRKRRRKRMRERKRRKRRRRRRKRKRRTMIKDGEVEHEHISLHLTTKLKLFLQYIYSEGVISEGCDNAVHAVLIIHHHGNVYH